MTAGAGGIVLDQSLESYPSANGELSIITTHGGNFVGVGGFDNRTSLTMLNGDSLLFDNGIGHPVTAGLGSAPLEINNPNPVFISISGNMESIDLTTVKATQITVTGDLKDVGFSGQNLQPSDRLNL